MAVISRTMWMDPEAADPAIAAERMARARVTVARWAYADEVASDLVDGTVHVERALHHYDSGLHFDRVVRAATSEDGALSGFTVLVTDVPVNGNGVASWSVEIRVVAAPDGVHTLIDLAAQADDPAQAVKLGRPPVVDRLLAITPKPLLGGSALPAGVVDVVAGTVPVLVEHIRNPARTLPVVVFTQTPRYDRSREIGARVAVRAMGMVQVVRLGSEAVTALRHEFGDLAVWGGAVRVYVPGPADSKLDAWRHRYIQRERVRSFETSTVDQLVMSAAQLSTRREPCEALERFAAARVFDDAHGAVPVETGGGERADELELELEVQREERADVERQLMAVTAHLERVHKRLREAGQDQLFWAAHDPAGDDMPVAVDTVQDAVLAAQAYLTDWVSVPDSAPRDLDGINTGANAAAWGNAAWRGLRALAVYAEAKADGFDGGFWEWCQLSGHPLAWPASPKKLAMHESDTVRTNKGFRGARTFGVDLRVDASGSVVMEAHLKIAEGGGNLSPRIYFLDDTSGATRKVHVGFVGPHYLVPNTKS